jgi:hypothetical protein
MITGKESQRISHTPAPKKRPNWSQIQKAADEAQALRTQNPEQYTQRIGAIREMHGGGDCGQIEPWSPFSLRDTYYDGWANGDFGTVLSMLGEGDPVNKHTQTP